MRNVEKKTHNKFHRDKTNVSWFKIGCPDFWGPVHGGRGGEILKFLKNSIKAPMGKDDKKTHSMFHLVGLK